MPCLNSVLNHGPLPLDVFFELRIIFINDKNDLGYFPLGAYQSLDARGSALKASRLSPASLCSPDRRWALFHNLASLFYADKLSSAVKAHVCYFTLNLDILKFTIGEVCPCPSTWTPCPTLVQPASYKTHNAA